MGSNPEHLFLGLTKSDPEHLLVFQALQVQFRTSPCFKDLCVRTETPSHPESIRSGMHAIQYASDPERIGSGMRPIRIASDPECVRSGMPPIRNASDPVRLQSGTHLDWAKEATSKVGGQ